MPRQRKPSALKKLEGTDRPDRDYTEPTFPEPTSIEAPACLISPEAVRLWKKLVGLLMPVHVLSEADLDMLMHLCNHHAKCMNLWAAGEYPTGSDMQQLRMFFRDFGLSPASRSMTSQLGSGGDDDLEKFFSRPKAITE